MKMIIASVLIIIGLTALSESENFSEETEILTEKSVNLTASVKLDASQEYCLHSAAALDPKDTHNAPVLADPLATGTRYLQQKSSGH